MDLLKWGLIPYWSKERPKPPPINAKAETVAKLPMFREAYRKRRCIVPVDGFFEWRAERGSKQPYAIAMKDRSPFGLAGLWENWKDPATGDWVRTFCVITTTANDLVSRIHDRMPAILRPEDYARWLGGEEPAADLLAAVSDYHDRAFAPRRSHTAFARTASPPSRRTGIAATNGGTRPHQSALHGGRNGRVHRSRD
jgi:putative SOS response-associated peptidase YedK